MEAPLLAEPVWPSAADVAEPAAAVEGGGEEKVEAPAEEVAVEPAAEAEEAPVAEEAPEEALSPEAPEVEAPLLAEPVWPSVADVTEPAATEQKVEEPVAAEEEVEEPVAAEEPAAQAEEAVTPEGTGDLWDLVPEEATVKGVEEQGEAERLEWAPAAPGPLPPAEPVEPLEKAPPAEPLPPRTGALAGTLEGTIVARASALVKAGRYGEAKRLVDRLGPTETLSVSALDLLVTIYTHEGQFDAAERLWRRAAGLDPAGHKGESAPRRGAQGKTPDAARRTKGKRWRVPPSVLAGSVAGVALIVIIVIVVLILHGCDSNTSAVVASKSPTSGASRTASTSASATPSRSASPTASPVGTSPPAVSLDVPGTHVSTEGDALEVTFDHGLFASGSAELSPDATDSLLRLAQQLQPQADELWVRVTGHTDDVPIARPFTYPDNVSLGMARAVAVVEFFRSRGGLPYVILSARSVDAIHPLGSNRTAAGRARNRTVVIAITRRTQ